MLETNKPQKRRVIVNKFLDVEDSGSVALGIVREWISVVRDMALL